MNSRVRRIKCYFDRRSLSWSREVLSESEKIFLRRVIPPGSLSPGETVLDLGGGTGRLADYLSRRFAAEVLLADISGRMLRWGRRGNGRLLQADGHCLPLRRRSLSQVFCFSAFPHFNDPGMVLREARRVLRPGGGIYILQPQPREEINHYHSQLDPEVAEDILPPLSDFRRWGRELQLKTVRMEDEKTGFIVHYLR